MKKHFYTHLVVIDPVTIRIHNLPIEDHEKQELILMMHETIHHVVIDTILSELSEEDKIQFLHHTQRDIHPEIWIFLNEKIENIEDKIKLALQNHTSELHQDIDEIKQENT